MKKEFIFLCILVLIAGILILFNPVVGWRLRTIFAPAPSPVVVESDLVIENRKLKAELAELQNVKSQLPQKPENSIEAIVYSRYPLNFKSELLVNAGIREEVSKGNAVVSGGMLIGKVSEVFEETSLIQTMFDERFQLAVRIGKGGAEALLVGGSFPALTLISPTAMIEKGDIVYSAGPDFPYGLPIGEIKDVRPSDDNLFRFATFTVPYDIGQISMVSIAQ